MSNALTFKTTNTFGFVTHDAEVTDGYTTVIYSIVEWKGEFVLQYWVDDCQDAERRESFATLAEAKRAANEWQKANI